jgi:hypothetical protein
MRLGVAGDQEGDHRQQEEEAGDVVGRVARLRPDDHVGVEHHRGGEQGGGPDRVGTADAPGGEQREAEPGEVDQRREEVAVERDDSDGVQELGVLRIEPGGELERVGEVKGADRGVLREPSREGHVVPGGVLVVHAGVEALLGRDRPVGDDQQRGGNGDREHRQIAAGDALAQRAGGQAPAGPPGAAEAGRDADQDQRNLLERADDPEQLGDHDQGRDRQHDLGQPSRGAAPARHDQRSHAVGA